MKDRDVKIDHVLVFQHRIDLVGLMEHFMNHDHAQSMEKCVQVLGYDGVMYKVLVAKLYPSFPHPIDEGHGPVLPLLWRTKLAAAYRIEDGKLIEVSSSPSGLYSRISSDKSASLGEYLTEIVPQFKVFTGQFGFQMGRRKTR